MASLAAMLKARGHEVYGSDAGVYPPMSDFLAEQNIPVYEGFDPAHLESAPDLVIVGNVISRGNAELEEILDRRLPYMSLPDALREFVIRGHRSIVVTGTHGKTTTTSLLAWLFEAAGREPGFMVGGIPKNFDRGFQIGTGEDFIVEGDEYDSAYFDKVAKFLRYLPDIGIITSIEFDHADIYDTLDDIKLAFRRFVNLIPRSGLLAVCHDDVNAVAAAEPAFCPVVTYGLSADADWSAQDIETHADGVEFDVFLAGEFWGRVKSPMFGAHNIRNALAAMIVAQYVGISKTDILKGVRQFAGVKRRLELKGTIRGIDVYDDFAHHPTAVRETLQAFRAKHPDKRIWALYEPRSATSRRDRFQTEFAAAFDAADAVLVAPVDRPEKAPEGHRFSSEKLATDLQSRGKTAHALDINEMVQLLKHELQNGDVVITFSNGPFGGIHEKLLNAYELDSK